MYVDNRCKDKSYRTGGIDEEYFFIRIASFKNIMENLLECESTPFEEEYHYYSYLSFEVTRCPLFHPPQDLSWVSPITCK
jgi:hypothetical protein